MTVAGPAPFVSIKDSVMAAIRENADIVPMLGTWPVGATPMPSIFTRKPVPATATNPCIVIMEVTGVDNDGVQQYRPVRVADIFVYGDNPKQLRDTEIISQLLYSLFHRAPRPTLVVNDHDVIDIVARPPGTAPTDDEKEVGRVVTITVRLVSTTTHIRQNA